MTPETATTALDVMPHAAETAHESGIHVVLAAEKLGEWMGIPITNTLIMSWIVVVLLTSLFFVIGRNPKLVPGRVQLLLEEIITYIKDFVSETLENEHVARKYLPLLIAVFMFIATSNLLEFTPGIGSVGFYVNGEFIPLLRSVNTDLNVTLALAIICVIVIEIAGVATLGFFRYAGKFINFSSPVNFAVGLIELVSEVSRLVSFSFRLFGNIFAGEVLLAVATYFAPYLIPVPLMGFEMFVGIVQGAVFALLTLFFIKLAITDAHAEEH